MDSSGAQLEIGSHSFDVVGFACDAAIAGAQHGVCSSTSVTGQHVEGFGCFEQPVCGSDNVYVSCIVVDDFVGAPIAHEPIHFFQSFFDVLAFNPIDCVDHFAGALGVHFDAAHISCAFEKSEESCLCRRCRYGRYTCKRAQEFAPRQTRSWF